MQRVLGLQVQTAGNQQVMKYNNPFTNFDYSKFLKVNPPNEQQTLKEISTLLGDYEIDRSFVRKYDDIPSVYLSVFDFDPSIQGLINHLLKCSAQIITDIKNRHDRARPYQWAEYFGIHFPNFRLASMESPSFPSGHSTQGWLIALALSFLYPIYKKKLFKVAENISLSRLKARCHFPSDVTLGKALGFCLAEQLYLKAKHGNERVPYHQIKMGESKIRRFPKNTIKEDLKWHTDGEHRLVTPLNENDWQFQFDNKLPTPMKKPIFIKEGQPHRVIKGKKDLIIKIN